MPVREHNPSRFNLRPVNNRVARLSSGGCLDRNVAELYGFEVASLAVRIDRCNFQVLVDWGADNRFDVDCAHLRDILNSLSFRSGASNLLGLIVRVLPPADRGGELYSHIHVTIETDAIAGLRSGPKCGRLPDVVEKDAPASVGGVPTGNPCNIKVVNPYVTLGVKFGRLRDAFERRNFWQDLEQESGVIQQFKATTSRAFG